MRKKILTLSAIPLLLYFIGGCGGSGHHTTPPPAEVPVVVTVSDQPPAGINVVSFDLSITGACLLTSAESGATSCSGAQSLISSSETIQFANLQTPAQSDVVANTTVEAGTYTGVLLTFGAGTATVTVDPGDTFTDGNGTTCDNTAGTTPLVCQLAPSVSSTTVTANFSAPVTLTSGTPAQIASVERAYNVWSKPLPDPKGGNDYDEAHSAFTFLIDRSGDERVVHNDDDAQRDYAADVRTLEQ